MLKNKRKNLSQKAENQLFNKKSKKFEYQYNFIFL